MNMSKMKKLLPLTAPPIVQLAGQEPPWWPGRPKRKWTEHSCRGELAWRTWPSSTELHSGVGSGPGSCSPWPVTWWGMLCGDLDGQRCACRDRHPSHCFLQGRRGQRTGRRTKKNSLLIFLLFKLGEFHFKQNTSKKGKCSFSSSHDMKFKLRKLKVTHIKVPRGKETHVISWLVLQGVYSSFLYTGMFSLQAIQSRWHNMKGSSHILAQTWVVARSTVCWDQNLWVQYCYYMPWGSGVT